MPPQQPVSDFFEVEKIKTKRAKNVFGRNINERLDFAENQNFLFVNLNY